MGQARDVTGKSGQGREWQEGGREVVSGLVRQARGSAGPGGNSGGAGPGKAMSREGEARQKGVGRAEGNAKRLRDELRTQEANICKKLRLA